MITVNIIIIKTIFYISVPLIISTTFTYHVYSSLIQCTNIGTANGFESLNIKIGYSMDGQ